MKNLYLNNYKNIKQMRKNLTDNVESLACRQSGAEETLMHVGGEKHLSLFDFV